MQDLPVSVNGYEFSPRDGPLCRQTISDLEQTVIDGSAQWEADRIELNTIYVDLFNKMTAFGISLIENREFLEFFTFPDYNGFGIGVKSYFFEEDGAEEFKSSDDLKFALVELYFERE